MGKEELVGQDRRAEPEGDDHTGNAVSAENAGSSDEACPACPTQPPGVSNDGAESENDPGISCASRCIGETANGRMGETARGRRDPILFKNHKILHMILTESGGCE